jgi:uncharacterized protein
MFARHFIDSLEFARSGMELRGEAAIAEMSRLQDVLATPEGRVSYVLCGLPDENGKSLLKLALNGICNLRCQRCLQALSYSISTESLLMPVPKEELENPGLEAAGLDEDEIDRIPADSHLDVLDLVEEEILLGLPLVPRHEPGTCQAAMKDSSRPEDSPFAILRGLKKD